ncbi:BON domain-containing protein [Paludisphaera mucosa]|uniref:BON domain-containing protein n=1 Tax=Paludisphaera mucosa TaxID=3030827 RepID=A0ABT6FGE2_9BACT|nr:BON domain-containing protein [Paludisphaera mucosa]MDG3006633.1 BON domain-containing protein [Paludisphaera mucosa]
MVRTLAALVVLSCVSTAHAQGTLSRVGDALDNAGRNIRQGVEGAVARGQVVAQERDLVDLVATRIRTDKRLRSSAVQMEVRSDGSVVLRGSVVDAAAKKLAAELVENTIGVTTVIDELAIVKEVRVIESKPVVVPAVPKPATIVKP